MILVQASLFPHLLDSPSFGTQRAKQHVPVVCSLRARVTIDPLGCNNLIQYNG
jgi:hypothetical protein